MRSLLASLCLSLLFVSTWLPAQRAYSVPLVDSLQAAKDSALAKLLAAASVQNLLPPDLISYSSNVETEILTLLRLADGNETVAGLEQVASRFRWNRTGSYDQKIVGFRNSRSNVMPYSMLMLFREGWLTPSLYGNRLRLSQQRESAAGGRTGARRSSRSDGADTLPAVHPLAADRDGYYRFSGGDTAVTIRVGERSIPIVSVHVEPKAGIGRQVLLFSGELDLDARRGALVRMRGYFVQVVQRPKKRGLGSALRSGVMSGMLDAVAYIDYENAEREGRWWLPARQRLELQATMPVIGDSRAVIRIVSRFNDLEANDTVLSAVVLAAADSLRNSAPRRLSYASSESIGEFSDWHSTIGSLTEGLHSDDFDDVAPSRWRTTGAPRVDFTVPSVTDLVHFNRVEGLYTGAGLKWALRDRAPGVEMRVNAGYAWSEHTLRGRAQAKRTTGPWTLEVRAGRTLDITNDFLVTLDSGNSFSPLISSVDAYDYVSRQSATAAVVRRFGSRRAIVRLEWGVGDDRYVPSALTRGPFGGPAFRANRGVDEGSYLRTAFQLDWRPDIAAEFATPGVGGRLRYERGDGNLAWQRMEVRLNARRNLGPLLLVGRADAGQVVGAGGRIPSQQLFELGRYQGLPGYQDKEFAGSRAAILRMGVIYTTPFFSVPIRVTDRIWLPPVAPGFSVGLQSGWTDAATLDAREAIARLVPGVSDMAGAADAAGAPDAPDGAGTQNAAGAPGSDPSEVVPGPTDRVRASMTAGFRFFGGFVFVGLRRPIDQAGHWKLALNLGLPW